MELVECWVRVLREISPPRMIVSPSAALTVAWAVMVSIRGERMIVPLAEIDTGIPSFSGPSFDFSASISMTTFPSGLMRGVTPMISPTFSSWTLFCAPF